METAVFLFSTNDNDASLVLFVEQFFSGSSFRLA